MTTLNAFFHPRIARVRRYLHGGSEDLTHGPEAGTASGPAPAPRHAREYRHLGPPADLPRPRHPGWLDSGGRVDRLRRNERHGDEKE